MVAIFRFFTKHLAVKSRLNAKVSKTPDWFCQFSPKLFEKVVSFFLASNNIFSHYPKDEAHQRDIQIIHHSHPNLSSLSLSSTHKPKLPLYISISLCLCLFLISPYALLSLSFNLSIYQSIYLSIYLSVYVLFHLSTYALLFLSFNLSL